MCLSQVGSFALPLTLATPILLGAFISECETWNGANSDINNIISSNATTYDPDAETGLFGLPSYLYWTCDVNGRAHNYLYTLLADYYLPAAVLWWLSFIWVTAHIWFPSVERLVQTER